MIRIASALVASCLLVAPAFAGDKEDIEALVPKFEEAVNSGNAAAAAAMYTEDGAMLPPGADPASGRANIEALWKSYIDGGMTALDLMPTEVTTSGNLAYEVGDFAFKLKTAEGEVPGSGDYLVVWRKDEDGTWRMHRDIWHDDPMEQTPQ